ncbi:MAG: redox-sensing transcriptional repressor Rex [Synergistaceae bacterium]|nr:redox-sensing transcriptional repressor Rex [Synergistaceae bacterium]
MKVAEPTVERLIQYYRLLTQMKEEGGKVVSSLQIGEMLGIKASQVRKDLSYFGEIGKRGVGYHVNRLCLHIENILASPRVWRVALAGVGNLGTALMGHAAFQSYKFTVEALFDIDDEKVGHEIIGVHCWHVNDIARVMEERNIEVLLLAVPASAAQSCVDKAVMSPSLKGILAFTPATVVVPDNILFYRVDIFVELEKLLFFLKEQEKSNREKSSVR